MLNKITSVARLRTNFYVTGVVYDNGPCTCCCKNKKNIMYVLNIKKLGKYYAVAFEIRRGGRIRRNREEEGAFKGSGLW